MGKIHKSLSFYKIENNIVFDSSVIEEDLIKFFSIKISKILSETINDYIIVNNGDSGVLLSASFYSDDSPSSIYENLQGVFIEAESEKKISDKENIEHNYVEFFPKENEFFSKKGLVFRIHSVNVDVFSGENCEIRGSYRKILNV